LGEYSWKVWRAVQHYSTAELEMVPAIAPFPLALTLYVVHVVVHVVDRALLASADCCTEQEMLYSPVSQQEDDQIAAPFAGE
jgi:hypothetical protein